MSEELPLTERERRIGEFVREILGDRADQPFKAFAIYREDLDRIEVLTGDCSICERGIGLITLYEDNHPEEGEDKLVGFAIEQARTFCRVHGLSTVRIDLTHIIDLLDMAVDLGGSSRLIDFEKLLGQLDHPVVEFLK